jgi:Flp pilus assembly protein CpaB
MEMEYKDPSKKGRWIVLLGVVLALAAGAAAFYLLNNAQQQAGTTGLKTVPGYVAARPILAGKPIAREDILLREDIPLDNTNAGVLTRESDLVGRLLAVDVPQGALLTANLLSSGTPGLGFKILEPTETVAPDSEAWRAVSITVEDARAVGGVLGPNMTVDVFVTASVTVPEEPPVLSTDPEATAAPAVSRLEGFMSGRSTKITYQGLRILARAGTSYILKVPLIVAEEISHMQAEGAVQFSLALRPDQDIRYLDVSLLGATGNRIIERYGLPIPQPYPSLDGPVPSVPPIAPVTPPPSPTPAPDASAAPTASPGG